MNQNNMLTEFNVGGSHEENKLGGIPIGVNPQTGAPVTVEEGETKTKVGGLDYVFSNNFKVSKSIIKDFKLPSSLEGLPMSDASKKISEMFKDRKDSISQNTMNQFLSRLSDAQENLRQEKIQKLQETIALNNQYPDNTLQGEAPQGAQEFMNQPPNDIGGMGVPQQQMSEGGQVQPGWFGTTKGDGMQANSGVAAGNAVGAASGIMGLVDQASGNTSPNTGKSALVGAASGAAVGSMIFPGIGTAVGAGVGAIAGAVGANGAQKKLTKRANAAAMNYNAQFQDQYKWGGILPPGRLDNNLYGSYGNKQNRQDQPFQGFLVPGTNKFVNPFQSNTQQGLADEIQYYNSQNPTINAQNYLINNGIKLNGGADGKWGPSSQAGLDAWRKSQGLNTTGPLTNADYEAMGYTPQGYTPYNTLPELTIDVNRQPLNTIADKPVAVTSDNSTSNPQQGNDPRNRINTNQMMRMMTPLGNLIQLGSLQEPVMGNMHQDLTKARRDYIDEAALVRGVRNQGNTLNRAIQQSGMTEGARRANMLGANLNTQNAIGSAMLQAQQANRQIDAQADSMDAQTRQLNQRNRMLAEENYERDKGAYNTERSKLQSQIFTDIGNIGLEGLRADRVAKVAGYDVEGNHIVDRSTGEKYDEGQIDTLLKELKAEAASASTEHSKKALERQIKELEAQRAKLQKVWDSGKQSNTEENE